MKARFACRWAFAAALAASAGGPALSQAPIATRPPVVPAAPPAATAPPVRTAVVRRSAFIFQCGPRIPADEFCRDKPAFNAYDARARLGALDFTYWVEGQNLNIAARSDADEVQITGAFQEGLSPLSMGLPYFGSTYRLPGIERAIVEMRLRGAADGPMDDQPTLVYRGPKAPPAPPSNAVLKGRMEVVELNSAALHAQRKVTIYTPPGPAPKAGWPAIIAADGDAIGPYLAILDALIERGDVRPVAVVAPWSGQDARDHSELGLRGREYLRRADADSYLRHGLFIRREVMPMAEKRFHITTDPSERMLFGYGEGADWALETAVREPGMATRVAAFSPAGASEPAFRGGKGSRLRLYMSAGAYEGPYLKGARTLYNLAVASFVPCSLDVLDAGHSQAAWQTEFAKVAREAFPRERRRR